MSTFNENCQINGLDLEVLNLDVLDEENEECWLYQSPCLLLCKLNKNSSFHTHGIEIGSQKNEYLKENEDSIDDKESQYDSLLSTSSSNYEFDQYLKHKLKSVADVETLAKQQEESLCQSLEYLTPFQTPPHKINAVIVPPSKLVSKFYTPPRIKINTHSSLTDHKNFEYIKQSDFNNLQNYLKREDASRTNSSCESESAFYSAGSEVSLNESNRISSASRIASRKSSRKGIPLLKSKLYDSSTLKKMSTPGVDDMKPMMTNNKGNLETRKSLYKIDETDASRSSLRNLSITNKGLQPKVPLHILGAMENKPFQGGNINSYNSVKQSYALKKKPFYPSAMCLSSPTSATSNTTPTTITHNGSNGDICKSIEPFQPSKSAITNSMANLHYSSNSHQRGNTRLSLGNHYPKLPQSQLTVSHTSSYPPQNQSQHTSSSASSKIFNSNPVSRLSGIPKPPGLSLTKKVSNNRHSSFTPPSSLS